MAIAKLPGKAVDTTVDPTSQIKENTKVNDVPPSTTPWVDTAASYVGSVSKLPVAGYPVTGNYYQQLKEIGDVGDSIDSRIDSAYQQYTKINNYVAKLQGELTYSTDPETKESTLVGEMILVDVLIPNRGDVWVMERGVNLIGLFVVTTTERLSPHQGSGYRVTIALIEESSNSTKGVKYESLESKVVKSVYYNDNSNYLGTKSTLTSDELQNIQYKRATGERIAKDYLREFYHRPSASIVMSTTGGLVYDPYLTKFILDVFPADTSQIKLYHDENANPNTFWGNLVTRNNFFSTFIMDKYILASTNTIQDLQYLYGVHHTPIDYIVRASDSDDPSTDVELVYTGAGRFTEAVPTKFSDIMLLNKEESPEGTVELIPSVGLDNNYVLSNGWYSGTSTNLLEQLISQWVNKHELNELTFDEILNNRNTFTKLERFYFYPIIVFLLMNS